MSETIKELRNIAGLTQMQVSELVNMPLRTLKLYENDESRAGSIKYNYIVEKLKSLILVDEEHGILSIEKIASICTEVFKNYDVQFCYLFGSYSKNTAKENSDVDLLISTSVTGLQFYGLAEDLRQKLKKKVDLLDLNQLDGNKELMNNILKDGVKIYG